jgi:hypothetical protein
MNSDKHADSPDTKDREPESGGKAAAQDYVPLSVRKGRQMHRDLWPSIWMSFASVLILAIALAILSYRIGAESCH